MHALVAVLIVICLLQLIVTTVMLCNCRRMESDISLTRSDVITIRRHLVAPVLGGRQPPSPAELQAARNRIDPSGLAHPGGT